MPKIAVRTEKVHGLIFDGAAFFGNILSFGFVPSLGDEVVSTTGGALLLLAVLTQIVGARWKKVYLAPRLAQRGEFQPDRLVRGFMNLLLLAHFLLFSVISLLAFGLLGIYDMDGSGGFYQGDIWVFIALLVGGFSTYLVRSAEQSKQVRVRVKAGPDWLEFGADGLLWVSVSLVTRIFWDGLVQMIEPSRGVGMSSLGIVLLIAMSILYLFFYLPSRYLFLVEDYRSGWTWVQVGAAMLPVIWLLFVG